MGGEMKLVLAEMEPSEQLQLCEDLFYNESALYAEAVDPELRLQHLEHVDAILDYHSDLVGMIGSIAILINNYYY